MEPPRFVFTHVHVYASDAEATVSWLTDGLGGQVVGQHQHGDYPVATKIRLGGQIVQVRGRRRTERFAEPGSRRFGLDHIGLSVPDFDATITALDARGIKPETSFDNGFTVPEGVAFLRGPDGLLVEITSLEHEPAPEVAPTGDASG